MWVNGECNVQNKSLTYYWTGYLMIYHINNKEKEIK